MSGRIVVIPPDGIEVGYPHKGSKPPPLARLQELVGGYIQQVRVRYDGVVRTAYVDEDGLRKSLAPNYAGQALLHGNWRGAHIVGPLVIWIPGHG